MTLTRPDTGIAARWGLTGFALLLLAAALVRAAPDGGDTDRRLSDLGERIKRLERTVGLGVTDSSPPSLDRRVSVLEDGLRELSRAGGQPGWSSVSENLRELRQLLRDSTQRQEELGRRLATLERTAGVGDVQRELRDLRGRLDDLRRQVDDLRGRVARLETRR